MPYDEQWKHDFLKIKAEIMPLLEEIIIGIKHVGSTSVQSLSAKPIIDIDVVIKDNTFMKSVISALEKIRYQHEGNFGIVGRKTLKYDSKECLKKHHLYVCSMDSLELKRHISFRDYLRTNTDDILEYLIIKGKGKNYFHTIQKVILLIKHHS